MLYFLIVFGIVIFDQITKIMVRSSFSLYESREIISGVFHLTYIENPGAAFGIMADQRLFFLVTTVAVIALLLYFMKTLEDQEPRANLFLAMVIGGAVGNFIDRVQKGSVTDFFDFIIWPVFNIADMFIVVGMLTAAFYIIKTEIKQDRSEADNYDN